MLPWAARGRKALQPEGPQGKRWPVGLRCGPWAFLGRAQADGAPASRVPQRPGLSRQAVSWNRILGLDRAASATATRRHGPASGAAQVHLVRLHRPGRGEEWQGLQIPAQGGFAGPGVGLWVGCKGQMLCVPLGFYRGIVKYSD